MEHEMRNEINKFRDFLKENSEEKLNISDVSRSRLSIQDMLREIIDVVRQRNLHQKGVTDKSLLDYIQKELNYMKNGDFDEDGNLIRSQR
jgi:translation initiation factor 2 beta subunit (eIF-2beta)/eIF-5